MLRLLAVLLFAFAAAFQPAVGGDVDRPKATVTQAGAPEEDEPLTEARRQQREEFAGIRVDEQLGEAVPMDLVFTESDGTPVRLSDLVDGERPTVLTFVYHNCPMLCSLVLNGLTATMREANVRLGSDYRVLAVSIDPNDTPELAASAKDRYGRTFDAPEAFHFLTGEEEAIRRLTDAVGFRYEWVEERQEYAHNAAVIFLSPEGRVTRYLYGLQYPSGDFRTAVLEAGEGRIGSIMDQILLYCFVYDPQAGGYILHAQNAMKLGGGATLLIMGLVLFVFWRREQKKNAAARRRGPAMWGDDEDALGLAPSP